MDTQVRFRLGDRRFGGGSLEAFNRMVEGCQDEAYTLAYRLLGSEKFADRAVAEAVSRAQNDLSRSKERDFRLGFLRYVIAACRKSAGAVESLPGGDIQAMLSRLPFDLRAAAVLVDVLGLQYREAASAMGSSAERVGSHLAAARYQILVEGRQMGLPDLS